jgi:hypothetical protein
MIPQLFEMVDRYGVDGFWIDGDIWAMEPCYCARCRAAFRERTGTPEPPREPSDPGWNEWWNFTRESLEEYVGRYCDAVHGHSPGVLVCSNWLQTFRHPGAPTVPTDWISGDNAAVWGLDGSRCEARFISTRGKPWDIMLWCFYFSHGWLGAPDWAPAMKPVEMLEQEAAVIVAFGGNVQVCENPFAGVRTGQLIPWRMKRIGQLARFVKKRRALCQGTETLPQIAVLHSEHHLRATPVGGGPWAVDPAPVQGAVFSLLECHYGVDILDEWALRPRLGDFPVIVAPEQDRMSDAMAAELKGFVAAGGRLLVTGAGARERFGEAFLGAREAGVAEKAALHVPAADGTVPVWSERWLLAETTTAKSLAPLGLTPLSGEQLLPHPAATLNRVGKGRVAWIPGSIFRDFARSRYPLVRAFIGSVVRALAGRLDIEVRAPACIDVILRRKGERRIVHLVNRSSGLPNLPNSGVIDEIPPVGPVLILMGCARKPRKVRMAFEEGRLKSAYTPGANGGRLRLVIPSVRIHAAVVVES